MPEEEKKRRKHTFTLEDRASAHIAGVRISADAAVVASVPKNFGLERNEISPSPAVGSGRWKVTTASSRR